MDEAAHRDVAHGEVGARDIALALELAVEPPPQLAAVHRRLLDRRHVALVGGRADQAPEHPAHAFGDRAELPVHPALGLAALAGIVGPERSRGVLRRKVAHAAVAFPDDSPAIIDGGYDTVGIHLEIPGLVVAA